MQASVRRMQASGLHADPITLEVIKQELISIPNQIDKNITRTAFSPLISEYKDYSVGIVDPQGLLISQSRGSLAIFVANALGTAVKDGLEVYGADQLDDGDVVISNHAGTLGQHLNNVVMYTPVRIGDGGELIGFFCVLVHWMDIGGIAPGSNSAGATTEIYQEGLQLRTVKLLDKGKRKAEMFRVIQYNTRFPELLTGDIEAQIGGCVMGCRIVTELAEKYGVVTFRAAVESMWDHAEAAARDAIRAAPDGEYRAFSFLDNDGVALADTVPIGVSVRIRGDAVTVDFSEVSAQRLGPLNSGRQGGAVAAARIAMKYLLSPGTPVTEGDFRPLTVAIPGGKFMSASAEAPHGSSGDMIPTVVDTILHAMASAFPERAAAAHHGTYGVHTFHGRDLATGKPFVNVDTLCGGWGAMAKSDGYGPSRSNVHGDTSNVPIEMLERFFPYVLESYALRRDSGGAGRFRGGLGVDKLYRVVAPCRINLRIDRTKCPPWGLHGGAAGMTSEVQIHRTNGCVEHVLKGTHALAVGDRVRVLTAGGGGYGPPLDRALDRVLDDVRFGYVSRDAALGTYGVAIRGDGLVDSEQTAVHRASRKGGNQ